MRSHRHVQMHMSGCSHTHQGSRLNGPKLLIHEDAADICAQLARSTERTIFDGMYVETSLFRISQVWGSSKKPLLSHSDSKGCNGHMCAQQLCKC